MNVDIVFQGRGILGNRFSKFPFKLWLRNVCTWKDDIRTITLDYNNKISATDFSKSNELINYLYNIGYKTTWDFIDKWDFDRYIRIVAK